MKRVRVVVIMLMVMLLAICSQAWGDVVELNETNFPDRLFRGYLSVYNTRYPNSDGYSYYTDGYSDKVICTDITNLFISGRSIYSLEGVEFFTSLVQLKCENNRITSLDVSKNTALRTLDCHSNSIKTLDLSANTRLEELACDFTISSSGENYEFNFTDFKTAYSLSSIELNDNSYLRVHDASQSSTEYTQHTLSKIKVTSSGKYVLRFPKTTSTLQYIEFQPYGAPLSSVRVYPASSLSTGTDDPSPDPKDPDDPSPNPSGTKPSITTTTLDAATVGKEYSYQIAASGSSPLTWTVTNLPAGLSVNDSGLITGTPTKKGSKNITVKIANEYGKASKKLTLNVYELPEITTQSLRAATVGKKYNGIIQAKGSTPLTWTFESELPEGLTLDTSKHKITGTPKINTAGTIRVKVSNPAGEAEKVFTLSVDAIPPEIKPKTLKTGTWGKTYKADIKTKGTVPITLTLDGELPEGLSFDSSTGKITGTPTEACTDRKITITASNMGGSVTQEYSLTIKAVAPKITTKKLPDAVADKFYTASVDATGTPDIVFSATKLPGDLSITESGLITGYFDYEDFGRATLRITATNASKTVKKNLTVNVLSAPFFDWDYYDYNNLKIGKEGKSYNHKFRVFGTKPISVYKLKGALPSGMTIDSRTGTLKGTPTEYGAFWFIVRAANSLGHVDEEFILLIAPKDGSLSLEELERLPLKTQNIALTDEGSGAQASEEVIIAAVLPKVSVDVAGMYDFDVTLSDDVPAGAKLVWLANSSVPSDDDSIAEFHTSDGEETAHVPDDRRITVSAWLNPQRVYRPAIAIVH